MRAPVLIAVLGLGAAGCGPAASKEKYLTAAVERGDVVARVTATGSLSALVTVQVGSQVSGRIASLHADFNSKVTRGQVLARLDAQLFQAALAQARANVKAAQGNLARAHAQVKDAARVLARQRELVAQKLVAQADFDSALAQHEAAEAQVVASEGALAQAQAQLQQAQVNLAYTTVVSPIDGTVISRAVDVGQTVAASLQAPTLFTIAENLARMQVDTNVAEADVGRLREGLPATFTVDAFPGRAFQGVIRQIRFAPQVVSNVVTYDAVIDVANDELLLRPGMTANVTFVHARAEGVLKVPNAALRFRPDVASGKPENGPGPGPGGRRGEGKVEKRVHLLTDGAPVATAVETGLSDGSFTEVKAGLTEGAVVVVDKVGEPPRAPGGQAGPGAGGMRRMF